MSAPDIKVDHNPFAARHCRYSAVDADTYGRRSLFRHYVKLAENYEAKVIRRGADECWGWRGSKNQDGYGYLTFRAQLVVASRVSWMLTRGRWAEQYVLHTCDNPECSNPKHLFLGTQLDNMQDAARKGRTKGGLGRFKTTCKHGHELVQPNLYFMTGPTGRQQRRCRECGRISRAKTYQRRKENNRSMS